MTFALLKNAAGNRRLAEYLEQWVDDLQAVLTRPGGVDEFRAQLRYIEMVSEAPADELHKLFATLGPKAEEAYMTTAEMLRAEGRAEGETRGRAEALLQLLTLKFGPVPDAVRAALHTATIEQLETWTDRVLTDDSLDHVLR